jgi:hypothetical protein
MWSGGLSAVLFGYTVSSPSISPMRAHGAVIGENAAKLAAP